MTKQKKEEFIDFLLNTFNEENKDTIQLTRKGFVEELNKDSDMVLFMLIMSDEDADKYMGVNSKKGELVFDWDCLPKWCNEYIAMDLCGKWYAYNNKPKLNHNYNTWKIINSEYRYTLIQTNFQPTEFKGDWEDSLTKNPNKQ